MASAERRAVAVVRVSQVNGREGDFSPAEQADRIVAACERDRMRLLDPVIDERDVSGGTPLAERDGLRGAVEMIEAGEADVLVVAYFDRLVRSLRVQDEVVSRVEAAGGRVLALDFGEVTNDSAAQWLSGTMIGAVSEYYRRSIGERVSESIVRAITRGVAPYGRVPVGYTKLESGVFYPDSERAPAVVQAFDLRAGGATINDVWQHLLASGIKITYSGSYAMLQSRVVLGEIHFGKFPSNLDAHWPIVDVETWTAVQATRVPSGRKAKSERLLARLGVLRCGACDSKLAVSTATGAGGTKYPVYRCGDKRCPKPVAISASLVEPLVEEAAFATLEHARGRASVVTEAREAQVVAERAQAELEAGIRVMAVVGDEPTAIERLRLLVANRDAARGRATELSGVAEAASLIPSRDRDSLTLDERRDAIAVALRRVRVAPGRGAGRLDFEPLV